MCAHTTTTFLVSIHFSKGDSPPGRRETLGAFFLSQDSRLPDFETSLLKHPLRIHGEKSLLISAQLARTEMAAHYIVYEMNRF